MFTGPSGIGKTTLAKWVSEEFNIPFISGSYYDLIGGNNHQEILSESPKDTYTKDWQLLNLRNKAFKDKTDFVTDRSFVDNAAYFWYKQDTHIEECELEHFISTCGSLMIEHCDILFMMGLYLENLHEWEMEDNKKRITNRYFQVHMNTLMTSIVTSEVEPWIGFYQYYYLDNLDLVVRKNLIRQVIREWKERHEK